MPCTGRACNTHYTLHTTVHYTPLTHTTHDGAPHTSHTHDSTGATIAQSGTITRYLANVAGLVPSDAIQAAQCDAVFEQGQDMGAFLMPCPLAHHCARSPYLKVHAEMHSVMCTPHHDVYTPQNTNQQLRFLMPFRCH